MLYVFHVEAGTMMTFDINLALESVSSLKVMIERMCSIPASAQVLLVSGGEVLRPEARVCSYSAGTDTNPIYMFSKTIIESNEPPKSTIESGLNTDLRDQVETCISMATTNANYSTVVACSQLAQKFYELAKDHTSICERLVHDQHLQQQGWAAVVANMEDVTNDFHERSEDFERKYSEHVKKRDEYTNFLQNFNNDLEALSSIPILPALRLNAASNPFRAFEELQGEESYDNQPSVAEDEDEDSENNKMPSLEGHKDTVTTGSNDGSSKTSSLQGTASEGDEGIESSQEQTSGGKLSRGKGSARHSTREAITLLHWITAKENQESLRDIAKFCKCALEMFDGGVMTTLRAEILEALESANQDGMKNIKGLEERLKGLEHLLKEARRIEQEQKDLAYSFAQNQQKAVNLGDVSVLRVLCESHCQQLQSMQKNEQKLQDIKGRCAKAKEELAVNLYHRLRWIVYVENRMFETDSRLMFYHRSLGNLKRHLAVIGQLHRAPKLFCTAVHEIVRRRVFSQAFLAWASDLASHLLTIHSDEVSRRRSFNTLFAGHFLSGLFPGTNDEPPAFATQPPNTFDSRLPKLTQADLQTLAVKMPHLASDLPPYDMSKVTQFFNQRSVPSDKGDAPLVDERTLAVVREAGVDRGFESETDTEEYEKVGQSPLLDRVSRPGVGGLPCAPPSATITCDATTITEENQESQRREVVSLKEMLSSVSSICTQSICALRNELGKLKTDTNENKTTFKQEYHKILVVWDKWAAENAIKERETLQRLTVDHELELNDIKQALALKDEEISSLKLDNKLLDSKNMQVVLDSTKKVSDLELRIISLGQIIQEQNKKLDELEVSKQKSLKELQEKMAHEYKTEVESLRSRFRLVALTSMDRSPSESSLEKIERADMIEINSHKAILAQTREDFEIEKEDAMKAALEKQEEELKVKMAEELDKMRVKHELEKQVSMNDTVRRIIEEKDRQLEQSRERESVLLRDCMKYKETIQQLSDPETSDFQSMLYLQTRLDTLEAEKLCLENKLNERTCEVPMEAKEQQTECIELKDSSTSPNSKSRQRWIRSQSFGMPLYNYGSCSEGETVMLVYDYEYSNFIILQDLNPDTDCMECVLLYDIVVNQTDSSPQANDDDGNEIMIITGYLTEHPCDHDVVSYESPSIFLLHIDCLSNLDLKIPAKEEERINYYIGKVESKDYCVALKSRNRYNVPQGTRFYRIKVRPLKPSEVPSKGQSCDISIVKEKESSQRRDSANMSSSTISSSNSTSKSVIMVRSARKPDEPSTSGALVEDGEQPDSIELNVSEPEPVVYEDGNNSQMKSVDKQAIMRSSCHSPSELPNAPEENVPYEVTTNQERAEGESSEQFISEVGEEAAP